MDKVFILAATAYLKRSMSAKSGEVYLPSSSSKSWLYGLVFIAVLAVPIGFVLFLLLQETEAFTFVLSAVLIGVLAVLCYLTFAAGNMRYELSEKYFTISLGIIKKKIPYNNIAGADVADLGLNLRLFGASLPGFHWGLFTTSIGRAHVYATKIKGTYVVLTLTDGDKIIISPEQTQEFLEAITQKVGPQNIQSTAQIKEQERIAKRFIYAQVFAVTLAYVAFLVYFISVYATLPEIVPVHFGFDGVANRWAHKSELIFIAAIGAIFPAINAVLTLKFGKNEKGMMLLLGTIFIAVNLLFIYIINLVATAA